MNRWPLVFWGVVMLAMTILVGARMAFRSSEPLESPVPLRREEPPLNWPVARFQLTERSGQTFDSQALNGKVWIASFFFTSCPSACTVLNHAIASLARDEALGDVTFVSITVDPETDTPAKLREYAEHFEADPNRWLFVTGPMAEIKNVAENSFKVSVERVTHSDRLVLIDRQGKVIGVYRGTDPQGSVLLKRKLAELAGDAT